MGIFVSPLQFFCIFRGISCARRLYSMSKEQGLSIPVKSEEVVLSIPVKNKELA